jgi:hypothetical protein
MAADAALLEEVNGSNALRSLVPPPPGRNPDALGATGHLDHAAAHVHSYTAHAC